jgi:hypothetical protein
MLTILMAGIHSFGWTGRTQKQRDRQTVTLKTTANRISEAARRDLKEKGEVNIVTEQQMPAKR